MALLPVRIVYRSRKISMPLLAAMEATDAWAKAGLDVERLDYVSGAAESDPLLVSGEVDFIFGSHISPYKLLADGEPVVCLGQSANWATDVLVSREPLLHLGMLRGRVLAEDAVDRTNHPWGNHKIYLRRAGVDLSEVDFVGADSQGGGLKAFELVAKGVADAAFVMPPHDALAAEQGLVVQHVPYLPMVNATTLTTRWDIRMAQPELCLAVVRAVREGIRFYKSQPEVMLGHMHELFGRELGAVADPALRSLYDVTVSVLDDGLYPTTDAIANAFRIAVLQQPTLERSVNPLRLWDLDLLRQADAS